MLEDIAGAYGSRFFLAAGGVGLALLCLIAILWLVRKRAPSPFVRGGKNRQPRLQVLDAAAVDARRRLVLVRRDGVEHLIMIGGPTDIVIESGISDPSRPGGAAIPLQTSILSEPAAALPAPQPEPVVSRPAIAAVLPAAEKTYVPEIETRHEPEPIAVRRPVAVAPPAPPQELFEPAPLAPVPQPKPQAEPSPAIEPAIAHRPAVAVAPVAPAPVVEAEKSPAPVVQQAVRPAPISESSVAEILDAARSKIMPQHIEHQKPISPPPQAVSVASAPAPLVAPRDEPRPAVAVAPMVAAAPVAAAPAVAPPQRAEPRELGGDFQSFLEAEMSNNLAAERLVPNTPSAQRPAQPAPAAQAVPGQRRDPEMAPITGADTELQTEVARIFGEMSVNRDR